MRLGGWQDSVYVFWRHSLWLWGRKKHIKNIPKPELSEPFFQKPEPEPPELIFRNRNRNRSRPFLLNCAEINRGHPKNTAFTRTLSNSSRELLPSSLWRDSWTRRKLFRQTCSDKLLYLVGNKFVSAGMYVGDEIITYDFPKTMIIFCKKRLHYNN